MKRRLAATLSLSTLAALPVSAHAQDLLETLPAWSAWVGGGSVLLLVIALALALGMSAKEPPYSKPRRMEPMPLYDPRGTP